MTRKTTSPSDGATGDVLWNTAKGRRMVKSWRASGLTVAEFARQEGIDPWRLYWWRRKLEPAATRAAREDVRAESVATPAPFLPVRVSQTVAQPPSCATFEVVMVNGRTVRVPADFDASALRRLLGVVEEVSP